MGRFWPIRFLYILGKYKIVGCAKGTAFADLGADVWFWARVGIVTITFRSAEAAIFQRIGQAIT
jgi:hypothetical protein